MLNARDQEISKVEQMIQPTFHGVKNIFSQYTFLPYLTLTSFPLQTIIDPLFQICFKNLKRLVSQQQKNIYLYIERELATDNHLHLKSNE